MIPVEKIESSKHSHKLHLVTYTYHREIIGVRSYFVYKGNLEYLLKRNLSYADIYLDRIKVL